MSEDYPISSRVTAPFFLSGSMNTKRRMIIYLTVEFRLIRIVLSWENIRLPIILKGLNKILPNLTGERDHSLLT
ncbi:MAG: hypothetical protein QG646_4126 [Euryarchaeota archaeon]|nr:hypothetical protein [Euryarchaeota archaeon]